MTLYVRELAAAEAEIAELRNQVNRNLAGWHRALDIGDRLRAENTPLREALDTLNADTEELINDASAGSHEAAKSHLIHRQAELIASLRKGAQ